jgi:hypothetical protein
MTFADEGTSMVGDLPGYSEEAYFGEDAAYTKVPVNNETYADESVGDENYSDQAFVGDVQPVGHTQQATQRASGRSVMRQASARINRSQPTVSAASMHPVSHQMMGSGYEDQGYVDGGYADQGYVAGDCGAEASCGCGSSSCEGGSSCRSHRRMNNLFNRCSGNTWAQMDLLLWFPQGRESGPLIIESDPGTLPIDDLAITPSAQTVFGGESAAELTAGFRTDAGLWLTDNVGVGGRFWGLAESSQAYAFSGNGDEKSVGRSFFNTDFGGEDSVPIALTGVAGGPDLSGSITAENTLDIWAAEAYARLRFGCSKNCQLDFIGGYSHFDIDDSLFIDSTTTIEGTGAAPSGGSAVGDSARYIDRFATENTFDGGQLGFEMVMNRGRWMAKSLTKVHLGNMNQTVAISGSTVTTPVGGPSTTSAGGVLAGNTPVLAERDVFAFAPEANFKLAYRFRPNVLLSVGYSFMYFDNVALTGNGIDRLVDGTTIGTGTNDNGFLVDDSDLWVHGIDLGFVIDF